MNIIRDIINFFIEDEYQGKPQVKKLCFFNWASEENAKHFLYEPPPIYKVKGSNMCPGFPMPYEQTIYKKKPQLTIKIPLDIVYIEP